MNYKKKISVIGQGYVGIPISLLLAKNNYLISAYDINKILIKNLSNGTYGNKYENEPDVIKLYKTQYRKKNINFTSRLTKSDIYVICVPTPIKKNKKPDLRYVHLVIKKIIPILKDNDLIIIESTIAIGSTLKIKEKIKSKNKKIKFYLSYCPERVLPGNAINEIIKNDRIIGGIDNISSQLSKEFYQIFLKGKIHCTSVEVAEFAKLSENAYRDINIAFANELSILCDINKVDYSEVIKLANKHPRVNILNPGIGVGGHCIPIDPWFLIEKYSKRNSIIRSSRNINDNKTSYVTKKIISSINKYKKNNPIKSIFFLGLSYKPNIGDLRESPAIKIVEKVTKSINEKFLVNDPYVSNNIFLKNKRISYSEIRNGIHNSSVIIILVGHKEYQKIGKFFDKHQLILDVCNNFKNLS